MKRIIINSLATTALAIMAHAAISSFFYDASLLFIKNVFEIAAVSLAVHVGLFFLQKYECKYLIIEKLLEIVLILIIVLPSGYLFDWYATNTLLIVFLMCIGIYVIGSIMDIMKVRGEIAEINDLLKNKRE